MKIKKAFLTLALVLVVVPAFLLTACGKGPEAPYKPDNPGGITQDPITQKTYTYMYNEATANNSAPSIELKVETLSQTTLVVPQRDGYVFCGWYLDWTFTVPVADELGKILIDDGIFAKNSNKLFAKWIGVDAATYEILMVFVTETKAILESSYAGMVEVDYKMTEEENQVYEMLAMMFEQYLNALLNGLVDFKVDTYFTSDSLYSEHFQQGMTNPLGSTDLVYNYNIFGYNIPEIGGSIERDQTGAFDWSKVGGTLDNYRTVITTFGMNDYSSLLHVIAGTAGEKYASIHQESLFGGLLDQGYNYDYLLDMDNQGVPSWWEYYMELYLHEFTHTVEMNPGNMALNDIGYHEVSKHYSEVYGSITSGTGITENGISEFEVIRLFLLNKAVVDGKMVGIPKSFWTAQ